MKKVFFACLMVFLLIPPLFADQSETRAKIATIKKEINRLEEKLKTVTNKVEHEKIMETIYGHYARVRKLEEELVYDEAPPSAPVPAAQPAPLRVEPEPLITEPGPVPNLPPLLGQIKEIREPRLKFDLGGAIGLFSSAMAINSEIRVPLPWIIGPATTSLRGSGFFAQTEDTTRKYVLVACDGLLNFPAGWLTGVENYLGVGLNYTILTSGRKSGTFGGQLTYGIERSSFGGKVFGEFGWAILRTGFSSSNQGVNVLLGFRKQIGLF